MASQLGIPSVKIQYEAIHWQILQNLQPGAKTTPTPMQSKQKNKDNFSHYVL